MEEIPPHKLMQLNGMPRVLFDGMVDRSDNMGFCRIAGESVRCPRVGMYSAGYVCKDVSSANTTNKKMITEELHDKSGPSTRTLHASLKYIEVNLPIVFKLENIINKKAIKVLAKLLRERLSPLGYALKIIIVNSRPFMFLRAVVGCLLLASMLVRSS